MVLSVEFPEGPNSKGFKRMTLASRNISFQNRYEVTAARIARCHRSLLVCMHGILSRGHIPRQPYFSRHCQSPSSILPPLGYLTFQTIIEGIDIVNPDATTNVNQVSARIQIQIKVLS